ncbi:hypothetical protein NQ315_006786 [Exocentrus adspersus]|uniref:Invertebrate defensins family profile domain-containing protein n=1 Tax=Exocentrus adspersus TaxID=1586481 RepID=A0AAV8WBH9_9CUCU|nr:hypothetical protein NQ315_006786 [Exocentrus adspersus]
MKIYFGITFILSLIVLAVYSAPVDFEEEQEVQHTIGLARVKRFTCDVLSVEAKGVKLNDAACGVHCLFRGKTGGYCNGKPSSRARRFTCDVLSFEAGGIKLNDAACAVHCVLIGNAGGHCRESDKVCVCR